jgi:TorA maturation chaperone TorD
LSYLTEGFNIIKTSEIHQLQVDRAYLYTFLSRLFTDHTTVDDLSRYLSFLEAVSGEYKSIRDSFQCVLRNWSEKDSADHALKTEYARLFIVSGGVRPYESVYLGSEPLLMREPWLQVKEFYHRNGLILEKPAVHPEDHASVELAFMAHLIEAGDTAAKQKSFFENHIYQWLPVMLQDLKDNQHACFFKEVALYTLKFMEQENNLLASLDDQAKTEIDQRSDDRL